MTAITKTLKHMKKYQDAMVTEQEKRIEEALTQFKAFLAIGEQKLTPIQQAYLRTVLKTTFTAGANFQLSWNMQYL